MCKHTLRTISYPQLKFFFERVRRLAKGLGTRTVMGFRWCIPFRIGMEHPRHLKTCEMIFAVGNSMIFEDFFWDSSWSYRGILVSATLVWLQVLFGSAQTLCFFFSGIRYPECIGVSHVSAGMRCHKMGHHFPHFPQVMDSIPPGEKQQKLQEFIDLIDPESLGAWMHRSGSVGYGKHLWLFFLGIHHWFVFGWIPT